MKIGLSPIEISEFAGIRRASKRPDHLRGATYDKEYDWHTLFYDVYISGKYTVFQGPPLFNFYEYLKKSSFFGGRLRLKPLLSRHIRRYLGGEIWIPGKHKEIDFIGPLGRYRIDVQKDMSDIFRSRRVLLTVSKDNEIEWITDWISFHKALHKADAFLIYDNGSTLYDAPELQSVLRGRFPDSVIHVVEWKFKWGVGGGHSGAVGGVSTPWDSNFCQTGVLQHARFRFLRDARSVLNCDIDELVVSTDHTSIFRAVEESQTGIVPFYGRWIGNKRSGPSEDQSRRHSDFVYYEEESDPCPTKWCVVPSKTNRWRQTWSPHTIIGGSGLCQDRRFLYRHFKAISTNWKYERWEEVEGNEGHVFDSELHNSFVRARLTQGVE